MCRLAGYLALLLFCCCCTFQAASRAVASSDEYYLRISRLDYPHEVLINSTFRIVAAVEYSLPAVSQYSLENSTWLVAARLYNSTYYAPSAEGFLITSNVDEISGTGSKLFTISASAPSLEETMNLSVIAMYRSSYSHLTDQNWLYTGESDSRVNIGIKVSATARLTFATNVAPIDVTTDGFQHYETDSSGKLEVQLDGLRWHMIDIPDRTDLGAGTRAIFVSWDDGSVSPSREVYLSTMNTTITATYERQFFLKVNDNGDGSGWYNAGSYANVSARQQRQAEGLLGLIGFVKSFKEWTGDLQTTSRSARIVMDKPHQITANWEIRYQPNPTRLIGTLVVMTAVSIVIYVGRFWWQLRRTPAAHDG